MSSVFKRDGRWYAKFKNEHGRWATRSCGNADKATAKRWAADRENECRDIREGRTDPKANGYREAEARPLREHIDDFRAMLSGKGNTSDHVSETVAHVKRIAKAIDAKKVSDLTADAVQRAIADIRDAGRSLRTCNAILRSVKTFMGWMTAGSRIRHNDVRLLQAFNAETDRRRVRRDISEDELTRIIAAARAGPTSFEMAGETRAFAYATAAGTGFRLSELRSLTPDNFLLDDSPQTIVVKAAYSKRRRDDLQPIDPVLARILKDWLRDKPKGNTVFALPHKAAKMLRVDMRLARAKWIREATDPAERRQRQKDDFLAHINSKGEVFDFHALRNAYISRVVSSGASVKVAQELARHSSPVLTIGKYAHARLADLRHAVPTVPIANLKDLGAFKAGVMGPKRAPLAHQTTLILP